VADQDASALEALADELGRRGYDAKLIAPEGREPWLAVRNPHAPMLAETVMAYAEWFWWPWADRIGPAGDVRAAADRVARVLSAGADGSA
jgi:hypothetical protein